MGRKKKAPTERLSLRLPAADLKEWREQAERAGLSLAEYVSRRVTLRPLTARKRKYSEVLAEKEAQEAQQSPVELPCQLDTDEEDDWDPKTDPELVEDERRWQARLESERLRSLENNRRWKANGLAYAAGGATRWFSLMTPEQHAEWDDLRIDMLRCERKQ